LIRHLELRFNLWDTESIKDYIRDGECGSRRKNNLSYAYRDWCRWKGFEYVSVYNDSKVLRKRK
jgi:hypothetical protein